MTKITKLKLGVFLIAVIAAAGYILDDFLYYSGMQVAEIFVLPVTGLIILALILFLIVPFFQKNK